MFKKAIISIAVLCIALPAFAQNQGMFGGYPLNTTATGAETIPADTELANGAPPQTVRMGSSALGGLVRSSQGLSGFVNSLICGDFGTCPNQRGTSGTTITTAATFTADRWAVISGTSTSAQWSVQTGAADITTRYSGSLRVQRTSGQTGVVATCAAQVLTSADSSRYQGRTGVFQAYLLNGANFSAANGNVTMTIGYGTSTDDTTANFLAGSWAGYTAAVATAKQISTTWTNYSVNAAIPVTATQVGVKICYTPVGTASTNDWFEMTGAQLAVNDAGNATAFDHRPASIEAMLAQRFFYQITETAAVTPFATCAVSTTSRGVCLVNFPVTMRAVPTMTYTTGFAMTVAAQTSVVTCTANATSSQVASSAANTRFAPVTCDSSAGFGAAGTVAQLFGNGGSGKIVASADL